MTDYNPVARPLWRPVDDGSHYTVPASTVEQVFYGGPKPEPAPVPTRPAEKPVAPAKTGLGVSASILGQLRAGPKSISELREALPQFDPKSLSNNLGQLVHRKKVLRNKHTGRYHLPFVGGGFD